MKEAKANARTHPGEARVVVFDPEESLARQLADWAEACSQHPVEMSSPRAESEIEEALQAANVAVIDATHDPQQAVTAFTRAVEQLGPYSVAAYTEVMHSWLELFVRVRGAQLLFGPLSRQQWDDFFQRIERSQGVRGASALAAQRPDRMLARLYASGQSRPMVPVFSNQPKRQTTTGVK